VSIDIHVDPATLNIVSNLDGSPSLRPVAAGRSAIMMIQVFTHPIQDQELIGGAERR